MSQSNKELISSEFREGAANARLKIPGLLEMNRKNLIHNWKQFLMNTITNMDNSYDLAISGSRKSKQMEKDGILNEIDQCNDKNCVITVLRNNFDESIVSKIKKEFVDLYNSSIKNSDNTDETTSSGSVGGGFEAPMGGIVRKSLQGVDEVTDSSSSGQYTQPKIWAKNKNNWRGNKKMYPGGKFVSIKQKCKKFPYCDEGPGAIELSNVPYQKIDKIFESISKKTGKSKDYVKAMFLEQFDVLVK